MLNERHRWRLWRPSREGSNHSDVCSARLRGRGPPALMQRVLMFSRKGPRRPATTFHLLPTLSLPTNWLFSRRQQALLRMLGAGQTA